VIVDAQRGAVYLAEAGGGIEAVDLESGRSLWRSDQAALPLALSGRLLIAQGEEAAPASRLPVVVLDVADKGRKVLEAVIPLPAEVRAHVNDALGRSFRASAEPDRGGFLVSWSYKETQISGVRPPAGQAPPERTFSGAARLRVDTGRVVAADAAPGPAAREPDSAERRIRAKDLPHRPWRSGSVLAVTEGGRGEAMTLRRWDARTGRPLPDRVLAAKALAALPSADQRHVLVSERVGAGGPGDREYRWSIFSLETARQVGETRRDESAAPFFVGKDRLLFVSQPRGYLSGEKWIEEPLRVRAVALAGGGPIWDRAIRDLEYRGATPPAPPGSFDSHYRTLIRTKGR
jgi:hypothetical protein